MLYEWFRLGGPVMYPLLVCSVVAMTVVAERLLFWMRLKKEREPPGVAVILELIRTNQIEAAIARGKTLSDPTARILVKGLEHWLESRGAASSTLLSRNVPPEGGASSSCSHWPEAVTGALEVQVKEELVPMHRYLGILETAITLSPLLGIYGTITGIIRAFGFLSQAGIPNPTAVAAGIAEALITTAAGLTIAILGIPAYNFFIAKAEEMTREIERHATTLELFASRGLMGRVP